MQIIPASWRVVGIDMDGDGVRDPQNVYDSAGAAMVYLCADGRDLSTAAGLKQAILSYNQSDAYLRAVLAWKSVFDNADLERHRCGAVRGRARGPDDHAAGTGLHAYAGPRSDHDDRRRAGEPLGAGDQAGHPVGDPHDSSEPGLAGDDGHTAREHAVLAGHVRS